MDANTPITADSEIPIRLIIAALLLPSMQADIAAKDAQEVPFCKALAAADQLVQLHLQTFDAETRKKYLRDNAGYTRNAKTRFTPTP